MVRPEVVDYLRAHLGRFDEDDLRRQLFAEGISDDDFEDSLAVAKANAKPAPSDSKPITITVNAQDQIFLQNTQVELSNLVATLQQAAQNNPDQRIFVRGDKDVSYGDMLQVMATITQGGFTKVALLAQPTGAGK